MSIISISPTGESFEIPQAEQYDAEFSRVESLAQAARAEGKEIVVVMGVGFVGAVMAAIIADTVDKETGQPSKFVIEKFLLITFRAVFFILVALIL